jgi:hypothetical protein
MPTFRRPEEMGPPRGFRSFFPTLLRLYRHVTGGVITPPRFFHSYVTGRKSYPLLSRNGSGAGWLARSRPVMAAAPP